MRIMYIISSIFSSVLVAGCVQQQVELGTLGYSRGHASVNEAILFENILRAVKYKHPAFVAASGGSGSSDLKSQLSATINIGPTPPNALSPLVSADQKDSASYIDFGGSKAAPILYAPLNAESFSELENRGWVTPIPKMLLIKSLYIHRSLYPYVVQAANKTCRAQSRDRTTRALCDYVAEVKRNCESVGGGTFYNDPRDRCRYRHFISSSMMLGLAGGIIFTRTKVPGWEFRNHPSLERRRLYLNKIGKNHKLSAIEISFRSPAEIISYLGALAAPQLYANPPEMRTLPVIDEHGIHEGTIFRVYRDRNWNGPVAVAARMYGERFVVPEPKVLGGEYDYSVRVMAYIIELLNEARKESPILPSPVVLLQ